ncbi:unnamed protein product [Anisakis simplex]|uniref:RING-type domain-containing protein n=1 Tax=Anisakis simplex TaxID=6269 RepID=A0A158PNW7_ANISI|nr:unnamed protein product [Anisakis simplex]
MQRLSSWFEQLPLRRRSSQRRAEASYSHKQQQHSKSAAPRLRYSFSSVTQSNRARDHSADVISRSLIVSDQSHVTVPDSWSGQETVIGACNKTHHASLSQSYVYGSGRMKIRTNPWISRDRPSLRGNILPPKPPNELLYASVDRCSSLRVKSLDESTCSSGYGSQDSSPDSSVHSPDWQQQSKKRCDLEDKAIECRSIDVDEALGIDLDDSIEQEDENNNNNNNHSSQYRAVCDARKEDEHIYHELEAFNRIPLSLAASKNACSSDCVFATSSIYTNLHHRIQQQKQRHASPRHCSSPIYAQPYQISPITNGQYSHQSYPLQRSNRQLMYQDLDEYDYDDDDDDDEESIDAFDNPSNLSEFPNMAASFTYIPCAGVPYRSSNIPVAVEPHFHAPPPPPSSTVQPISFDDLDRVEMDFLAELDAQIAELQVKSVAVRQLVDEARERRDARARTKQLCMEQLAELKQLKWVMRDHFELVL